jgi:hypothetical protein
VSGHAFGSRHTLPDQIRFLLRFACSRIPELGEALAAIADRLVSQPCDQRGALFERPHRAGQRVLQAFVEGLKSELLKTGHWTGALDQRTKEGRQLTVASRLQLESFDDRRLVIEHST